MPLDFDAFIKLKQNAVAREQENYRRYRGLYEQALKEKARENKIESYQRQEQNALERVNFFQAEINIARPEIPSDTQERLRIIKTYPDLIKNNVSENEPLFFHGVSSFATLEQILSSGHLGYLQDEDTHSFTAPGMLDVTTANSVATSIEGFTGLNCSDQQKFLPAGCLIVIAPQNEEEKAYANQNTGSEHSIPTVNFKENPDRIIAIVSTTENKDNMLALAAKYNLNTNKIRTFDEFIEDLSQKNTQNRSNQPPKGISFISTEISGFYASLLNEGSFHQLRLSQTDMTYENFRKELPNHILDGSIQDVHTLNAFVKKSFPDRPEKVEQFCNNSTDKATKYSQFYHDHADAIAQYKQAMQKTQYHPEKGYAEDVAKLYDFFDVDKSFKCYGILAPVQKKIFDGMALGSAFLMCYNTQKEPDKKYIDDSLLPERKVPTPLHETTHLLFAQSKMKKDLYQNKGEGAEKLLSVLEKYFKANPHAMYPQMKRDDEESLKRNARWAIDEALASSSDISVRKKYGIDTTKFYHDFEGADTLAKSLYPVFRSYITQGKMLDDGFWMQVADHFIEDTKINIFQNENQKDAQSSEMPSIKQPSKIAQSINSNVLFEKSRLTEANAQRAALKQDVISIVRTADGKSY